MSNIFLLPDLGEGLTEADLVRWLVAEGDEIAVDQPVCEVETAKAIVEVPSPYAGVVLTLHGSEGETMEVGKPLFTVGSADEAGSGAADGAPAQVPAAEIRAMSTRNAAMGQAAEPVAMRNDVAIMGTKPPTKPAMLKPRATPEYRTSASNRVGRMTPVTA